jgi:hypothetical protein
MVGREADGKTIKLWDATTGRLIRAFDVEPPNGPLIRNTKVTSLAFSPDGARAVSLHGKVVGPGGSSSEMLRVWQVATGHLLRASQAAHVRSVAFSHDGRHILSGERDGTIRIRETQSGALVATLISLFGQPGRPTSKEDRAAMTHGDDAALGNEWLVVTPEGFFDASSQRTANGMLSLVRGLQVSAIDEAAYQRLHRPDLVRAKLAGDPDGKVKEAAAELEAKLRLH